MLTEPGRTAAAGFYTLAATSIALADIPGDLAKALPRYPFVPAYLMGRLAVDTACRGKGYGQLLLMDAFSHSIRSEIVAFAFVVDAKDEGAAAFYAAHRLLPLTAGGRRMFIPTSEIAKLFL